MEPLSRYQSLEVISSNHLSTLYKGFSTDTRKNVLIKIVKEQHLSKKTIASMRHEFDLAHSLEIEEILRPINLEADGRQPYVVYEYFPCETLRNYLKKKEKFKVGEFLKIAIKLATALVNLNRYQLIHKNINPSTILLNHTSEELKLTGLQYTQKNRISNSQKPIVKEMDIELAYISPEQTGRINRNVDFQSDLYSLGVVFYEMITGQTPFIVESPYDWFHVHLTKHPPAITDLNEDVPEILSNIIMKLISKSPIDRYKSSYGLREDLITCLHHYENDRLTSFAIGEKDTFMSVETNNRLFGREEEVNKLLSVCNRTLQNGETQLMLISGESGTGKTALVDEVLQQFTRKQTFLIQGKFDLLLKQNPYSAILDAFKMLFKQILTEDETNINKWGRMIEDEIGSNLSILLSVLPELKWIVNNEIEEVEMMAVDMSSHFYYLFQKLVRVFAQKNHSLILFLDDLQWADSASIELIEYLLSNQDTHYFLMVGAYRENEIKAEHLLYQTINRLKDQRKVQTISLDVLSYNTVSDWIQSYLSEQKEDVKMLGTTIYRITQGNPFFIKQLLLSFYENYILYFNEKSGYWSIDETKLSQASIQDNVVFYLINRLKKLPETTQKLIQIAACIGNQFDLHTVYKVAQQDQLSTSRIIDTVIDMGLLLPSHENVDKSENKQDVSDVSTSTYRFIHDRVQQVIYSTMSDKETSTNHLAIGRELICSHDEMTDSELVNIVYHLNLARHLLAEEETIMLAKMNVNAGEFAKNTAAYQAALTYYKVAYELLGEDWENHYDLTFKLLEGLGEAQYINGNFDQSEHTFNTLLKHSKTKIEKLSIYNLKITLYTHVHRVEEAVDAGLAGLQLMNQKFPLKPSKLHIVKELLFVKLAFVGKQPIDLLKLPDMESEENRLILRTLIQLNAPTYHVDQNLSTIFMLKAMRMTIQFGLTELSPLVFNNYALILSAGFHDFKQSFEFGNLALLYAEENGNIGIKGRVSFVFASFVNHWKNHIKDNIKYLEQSQKYCIQAGNIHLAGANSSFLVISHFIKGTQLEELKNIIQSQKTFIEDIKYPISAGFMAEMQEWFDYLTNDKRIEWHFNKIIDDDSAKIIHYTMRLHMAYLFNKNGFANQVLKELASLVNSRLTLVIAPEFYFFEALWHLRFIRLGNNTFFSKRESIKKIKRNLRKLKKYAKMSPENYESKKMLVMAELAAITNNKQAAEMYFDKAIQSSEENQFLQMVALCNEAAGRFYAERKKNKIAGLYFTEAYHSYLKWGATKKAQQLSDKYRTYMRDNEEVKKTLYDQQAEHYDLNAVYKAAQIISSEMKIEQLLEKVIHITMENTGATKGTILFKQDEELIVVAHENYELEESMQRGNDFSANIVQYVNRTGNIVQLDDASNIGIFQEDEYVLKTKGKSIICIPIFYYQKLKGILYLENDKVTNVFTNERISFLTLLSTQAAISIENAQLYKNLEDKVSERTAELQQVNQTLAEANKHLAQSEEIRRELLSNISHDLRAPIASIQGYMEAILDGLANTEEKRDEYIRNSISRIKGLNVLINDLFDLTQLESGNLSFSFDYVPADKLLENIKRKFLYEVTRKNLLLQLELNEDRKLYPLIEIDIERIGQVFANLITNAIKHTNRGGIHLKLEIDEQTVLISCRDTGGGIADEDLPYIFERNFTIANHPSRKGHGLGLTICKEIIKHHNGEIWAESEIGKGTTFFIQLPVVRVEEELVLT
ncbi:ATP-binding sensor histidine kinase [Metabacillus bambusae]|uniref:histidine kinase n=1 Tax=Metabacillus bambusae TaxID=2795218 RepID=A0ABS3N1K4_9BACI|nr:ATP-binding sensor histidine kinase [Metabacillus bambusae]MBO1512114.1 AAA family ATPase [Metabacillus bambusae]